MKIEMPDKVADGLGQLFQGLGYMVVLIGFGTCCHIEKRDTDKPVIEIRDSFNRQQKQEAKP